MCEPDLVVGASAGAWNGWAIAGGASRRGFGARVAGSRLPRSSSGSDCIDPAGYGPTRFTPKRASSTRDFSRVFRSVSPWSRSPGCGVRLVRDREITWEHLAAACSIPLAFPPVAIEGRRYVDGGLLGALPLWAAEEMGATRVIAVNCLTSLPFRLVRVVFRPRKPSSRLEVIRIEPGRPLGSLNDALFWNADNIRRWIEQGARDAKQALSSVRM